jgi:protein O-mannosyl-transferase
MFTDLFNQKKILNTLVFVIPVILYINTIKNDYALDDSIVITENNFTKEGISGLKNIFLLDASSSNLKQKASVIEGGRYRPLSVASFALEYSIWKNNPHISHLINVLLYGLLCLLVFITFQIILKFFDHETMAIPIALFSTMLFAMHPIHTEVVANIKGRDEILSLLFSLFSLHLFLIFLEKKKLGIAVASAGALFLGLLSKENSICMLFVAGLLILMNFKKELLPVYIKAILILFTGVLIYLKIRYSVVGSYSSSISDPLMNNPYIYASLNEKITTILYTLLLYLKLLIYPHPLTYDYYPYHIQLQSWHNPLILLSLGLYILMILVSLYFTNKKKIIAFSIFIYIITLIPVSNIFINIGTFMNERFIFFGSIGYCLLGGYLLWQLFLYYRNSLIIQRIILSAFAAILIFYAIATVVRNTQWKDNYTLFLHDVKISSGSAKGNFMAGAYLLVKTKGESESSAKRLALDQSISYLKKATEIYPGYVHAILFLGDALYARDKNFGAALPYFTKVFKLAPNYDFAYTSLKKILSTLADPYQKKKGCEEILKFSKLDFEANYQLGLIYGKNFNRLDSAVLYLSEALRIKPDSKEACRDLGVALAYSGKPEMALGYFEKTLQLDPYDPSSYTNIAITYQQMGNNAKAAEFFKKAQQLKSSGRR